MRKLSHKFDFCVVGGGIAGLCELRYKKSGKIWRRKQPDSSEANLS